MQPERPITPSTLSVKDLRWQVQWDKEACTLCGKCTAVCPVNAVELGVFRKRRLDPPVGFLEAPATTYGSYYGIRQKTDPAYACVGCAMCNLVCPNNAIAPAPADEADKLRFQVDRGGQPRRRGGRRNVPGVLLDRLKFVRISMLTDPALDAGRHEFELRTLLGRVLPPEENLKHLRENGWVPPVREIYPLIIGGMSFGALSPNMWEGLQMGAAYLNEELGMPVRMCTGEGGCPPRLLRSRFLKYVILQVASGYFGWDEILHALPEMKEDPCAIEIKYGQGAKPGDGGLLMWYKVNKLIAAIRGVPQGVSLPSPPTHQTKYSIEEAVAKMIQSMYMAWGFRVPVYPKISATSTTLAVLNNLTRNPYAAALAIDGEDGGTGAAYNVSMNHMGHPIASNLRDAYLNLVKIGKQNEIPLFAGGGIGKNGNLAANAAALIMLGASGVQTGKYIMQAAAGCLGSEGDRCNICNIGVCPKGITSQDSRLDRRLDPEQVAQLQFRIPTSEFGSAILSGPGHVLPGPRIDLDPLPGLHEERHPDHGAGLGLGRLVAARGGVAADAGVGLDDLEDHEVGRGDDDGVALVQGHRADVLLLEPLRGVTHLLPVGADLLVGLLVHEVPHVAVGVEVLHLLVDDVGALHRVRGLEGHLVDAVGAVVLVADAGEGLALAGLDDVGVDDNAGIAVDCYLEPDPDLVHVVRSHGSPISLS